MVGILKPEILLTNDDGCDSPLLLPLARSLAKVANLHVIAPASGMSGVSHAFTGASGVELRPVSGDYPFDFYSLTGTPADCTKFGLRKLFGEKKMDCVISGPNAGENSGVSSLYSGTVAGAREAALWGIPGMALSLADIHAPKMLDELCRFAAEVVEKRLFEKIPAHGIWNVNYPDETRFDFRGYRVARQELSMFTDHYEERDGKFYLGGWKEPEGFAEGSDDSLLEKGFATITPLSIDQTFDGALSSLETLLQTDFKKQAD